MKASAIAHPIQGIVKYHGLRDVAQRLPFHDSISLATGPIRSHTTVEVLERGPSQAVIDGVPAAGRAFDRIVRVMEAVRDAAGDDRAFRMASTNDFPQFVGLGSSSSGFAALAVAGAAAYRWEADLQAISEAARLGAGSATRAVTGGLSEWVTEGPRSFGRQLLGPDAMKDWAVVVPLVPHPEPTDAMHAEAASSPLFQARVASMPNILARARQAASGGALESIWAIAEEDTLSLHAITMTGSRGHVIWRPATLAVIHKVRELRGAGTPVFFSIDTGATAYLNTHKRHAAEVEKAVREIPGVEKVLRLVPGGAAHVVDDHLF